MVRCLHLVSSGKALLFAEEVQSSNDSFTKDPVQLERYQSLFNGQKFFCAFNFEFNFEFNLIILKFDKTRSNPGNCEYR